MQRILAVGGGGFMMEDDPSPIDAYIRNLTGKQRPRICFIPTASGDLPAHIDKFYRTYEHLGCEPSHLCFFRQADRNALPLSEFGARLLEQDAVFVGGGNTKSLLAVWREWQLDRILREAAERGILLSGMSAGAICWFEAGLTDSFGGSLYRPLQCLGLLPGGCSVHHGGDANRRPSLDAALRSGTMPASIAIDDFAAAFYEGNALQQVVSWRPGAAARQVAFEDGRLHETTLDAVSLRQAGM